MKSEKVLLTSLFGRCPMCHKEVTLFWNAEKDGNTAHCPYCGRGTITLITEEEKDAADAAALRLAAYERFKLWWMMTHGYSLRDLMQTIDSISEELHEDDPDFAIDSQVNALNIIEEFGFGGGSIWPCYDEFLDHEYMMPDVMRQVLLPHEWEQYVRFNKVDDVSGIPVNTGFSVSTPLGDIVVCDKQNPDYPGIFIDFSSKSAGEDEFGPGCMLEYTPGDLDEAPAVVLRVYEGGDDEPTQNIVICREEQCK